jgi:hypothetical protein
VAKTADTFCVLPWIHLFADERGVIHPCCFSHRTPVLDPAGTPYGVDQPGAVDAAWNAPVMRTIRKAMVRGERPAACAECFAVEDSGGTSYRHHENEEFGSLLPGLIRDARADGTAPLRLRYVDLRLGNVCNLRCRMCSPQASRLLADEFREIRRLAPDNPWLAAVRRLDWFADPVVWETLARHLPSLDRLHFAGGEPLVIREGFAFLRRVVESGEAGHITLTYNTNVTVLPPEAYEYWPHFKGIQIIASLDGFDAVNHYIRYPARWDAIDAVLTTLERDRERLGVTNIAFHATVQVYNVLRLTELFDYLLGRCTFATPYPRMDLVQNWPELDIQILPGPLKALATERLDAFKARLRTERPDDPALAPFFGDIDAVVRYLHAAHRSHRIPQFRRTTAIYDARRGQRLADVVPELAPLMAEPTGWRRVVERVSALLPSR